ncbi:MAG: V-type ATP synthase subunit E [Candidatus Hermodarchaeia archaeon]
MSNISSADQIEQTIISEAKANAKRIINDAEVAARQYIEAAQDNAHANLTGWAERRKQMAQGSGDRILGKAQNDAHMRVMNAKARMMDEAFKQARKRFEKERGTAKYKTFIKNLIIDAGTQIGGGDFVILSRKEDQPVISKITGLGTAISKGAGKTAKVSVGKQAVEMIGGVMVQNKEGNITVDYRVETLLAQVEIKYRNEIAKTLFPKKAEAEKSSE